MKWSATALARRSGCNLRLHVGTALSAGVISIGLGLIVAAVLSSSALSPRRATALVLLILLPFVAVVIGRVRELLLAIVLLDIPFGFDVHFAYRVDAARMGGLAGFNVSATSLCLAALYALWIGEFFLAKRSQYVPGFAQSTPLALYVLAIGVSALVATDIMLSAFQFALMLQMLLLYLYLVSTVRTRRELVFLLAILMIGLIGESLIMIFTGLTGRDFSWMAISTAVDPSYLSGGRQVRIGGTLGSPNNAAAYIGMVMLVASSFLFTRLNLLYRFVAAAALALGGVSLMLTGSRGGWAAFTVALLVLWYLAWRRDLLSVRSSLAIVLGTVVVSALFHEVIVNRLFGDDRGAAYSRIPLMQLSFAIIRDHPILGVAANHFTLIMGDYVTHYFRRAWLYTVHNKYLLVWAETGLLGLAAFLWFLAATLRTAWRCSRVPDSLLAPVSFGLAAAILAHTAHMFVDVFNDRQMIQLLTVTAALITALSNLASPGLGIPATARRRWRTAEPPRAAPVRGSDSFRSFDVRENPMA